MGTHELRDYQIDLITDVFKAFEYNSKVMIQMPTGTGKTHVFCEIIKRFNAPALVLVHTRELLDQAIKRLEAFEISCGKIISGYPENPSAIVQVATIQTLILRNKLAWPENIALIVIDEAHHSTASTYRKILKYYESSKIKILGVTATPCRMNGSGFKMVFDQLITSKPIQEFIDLNHLSGFRHYATATPDLKGVKFNEELNEYNLSELGYYMSGDKIMADIVESYKNYGDGKQCILFSVNRSHSKNIVNRLLTEGIKADFIDSKTTDKDRKRIIAEFKNKQIQVLVNVKIFTEGFDCPDIEVVQLVRPTKSLSLYLQMVGRALRICEGKEQAIIIDNAGLWKTHGIITKDRKWTLDGAINDNSKVTVKRKDSELVELKEVNLIEIKGLEMEEIISVKSIEAKTIYEHAEILTDGYPESIFKPEIEESLFSYLRRVIVHIYESKFLYKYAATKASINGQDYKFNISKRPNYYSELYSVNCGFLGFYLELVLADITDFSNIVITDSINDLFFRESKSLKELKNRIAMHLSNSRRNSFSKNTSTYNILIQSGLLTPNLNDEIKEVKRRGRILTKQLNELINKPKIN